MAVMNEPATYKTPLKFGVFLVLGILEFPVIPDLLCVIPQPPWGISIWNSRLFVMRSQAQG